MIQLTNQPIDTPQVLEAVASNEFGAVVPFIGTVRAEGNLSGLFYDCHDRMAEKVLQEIARGAEVKFDARVAVVHRVGWVPVGEASVVIAAAAPHRREAFEACRFVIEAIKERVPIWKEEKRRVAGL